MARLLARLVADGHLTHDRPVAALLHDVLPWIPDDARVGDALAYLRTWLPPGSALSITHATATSVRPGSSGSKTCTARRASPSGPGTGRPSPASSGSGAASTAVQSARSPPPGTRPATSSPPSLTTSLRHTPASPSSPGERIMREGGTHSADELTRRRLREPRPAFRFGPRAGPERRTTLTTWPGWLPGHARSGPRGPYLVACVRRWAPAGPHVLRVRPGGGAEHPRRSPPLQRRRGRHALGPPRAAVLSAASVAIRSCGKQLLDLALDGCLIQAGLQMLE
ncbi:hypothetical protein [Streptomyces goshikiensis]|uniref:hypothetical protein n=1 Tax=Streptomyces goshikiensis TaxID=1942 RepID=UPI0033A54FAC